MIAMKLKRKNAETNAKHKLFKNCDRTTIEHIIAANILAAGTLLTGAILILSVMIALKLSQ